MKVLAQKIRTTNTRNGNPRRGWLVYRTDGEFIGFCDEGYRGFHNLKSLFPAAVELAVVLDVIPSDYTTLVRDHSLP